ncbi:putative TetR family transcriptional regulator [Gordonia araii NBRC 100433]|uniref:Putative TetR family transcriptional regulator n=1 Tax=Gordonia araii NBRC 100433 TaxID=1073574 RepID=G7GX85_9ACTN|nr:TetR/AcrR family transcriptional regulator [Gordonia araii]NNG98983.1 TetR/AcrR family transcriptional regulator [Gordonia araii NBRC 100433]GAB08210.1 putative TetR family transcriptional regulator [Gordonia araii NBRC 100433]
MNKAAPERGARDRMIAAAADLIGRDGVAAASIGKVLAASRAPRGSIYHHFPGGRTELMTEGVRHAGSVMTRRIVGARGGDRPSDRIREIGDFWRTLLVQTDYEFGCPVLAGGLAHTTDPEVAAESGAILDDWQRGIADKLTADGVDPERAASLATLVLSAVEGAVGLCQALRTCDPLDSVVEELGGLCDAAAE